MEARTLRSGRVLVDSRPPSSGPASSVGSRSDSTSTPTNYDVLQMNNNEGETKPPQRQRPTGGRLSAADRIWGSSLRLSQESLAAGATPPAGSSASGVVAGSTMSLPRAGGSLPRTDRPRNGSGSLVPPGHTSGARQLPEQPRWMPGPAEEIFRNDKSGAALRRHGARAGTVEGFQAEEPVRRWREVNTPGVNHPEVPTGQRGMETPQHRSQQQQIERPPGRLDPGRERENFSGAAAGGGMASDVMIQALSEILLQTRALRVDGAKPPRDLTYSGFLEEDPEVFLNEIEEWMEKEAIPDNRCTATVKGCLRGAARQWADRVAGFLVDYQLFRTRFLVQFNSGDRVSQLLGKLYGDRQTDQQSALDFVTQKYALFNKVLPDTPETERLKLIQEQLLPEIRLHIRALRPTDIHDMLDLVMRVEEEVRASRPTYSRREQQPSRQEQPPRGVATEKSGQKQGERPAPQRGNWREPPPREDRQRPQPSQQNQSQNSTRPPREDWRRRDEPQASRAPTRENQGALPRSGEVNQAARRADSPPPRAGPSGLQDSTWKGKGGGKTTQPKSGNEPGGAAKGNPRPPEQARR